MPISQTEAGQLIQRGFRGDFRAIARAVRGLIDGDFISSLTDSGASSGSAGTATALKPLVLDANKGISGFRMTATLYLMGQGAANALNATGTLTAAMMLGGIVTSTTAAAVTATLDTGTLLETALLAVYPGLQNNDYFEFSVINTGGANAITLATATGWTDGGNGFAAVAAGQSARFGVRRTAANTYTIFKVA